VNKKKYLNMPAIESQYPGQQQLGAGFSFPEGKKFYIINQSGNVKEIRSVFNLGSGLKYLIERNKGDFSYVSPNVFYFVPEGCVMKKID
jgi:hypothetical protein